MDKILPDKWIRKAVYDALDGLTVDSETIYCFDSRVTPITGDIPDFYVLMSTQSSDTNKFNKCEYLWDCELLLDIRATYDRHGNIGSRLMVDDMADAVRNLVKDLQVDVSSGLTIINRTLTFPGDLNEIDDSTITYRNLMRLILQVN